ncbi:hypothetical protein Rsub_08582 [Raphidocelis subcapitata]|uniref:PAS domain-containing protein n=1 Tax=Raphidocelis subcapitata TaxID=307507 RepID=A0A2V0PCI8_9CHLO|nr:hypothetical protein Rsub_08582 [Raphidocelis subcapitata]|eukprot:GBF95600.1 hypothetical protein Rsub_08582 [Raphidocelis subcapitata]
MSESSHSYSTGTGVSDSEAGSEAGDLAALGDDEDISDLLEGSKGIVEAMCATLVLLTRRASQTDLKWVVLRIVLEFLQMFRVVFNTSFVWVIDRELWAFKAIKWVLIRFLVLPTGYKGYIIVLYVMAGIIVAALVAAVWLALALRKDDTGGAGGWLGRLSSLLQLGALVMWTVAWVSILDYMVFLADCEWTALQSGVVHHSYFKTATCTAMPHVVHMAAAAAAAIVLCVCVLCMAVGECDLNPLTRQTLAATDAATNLRITLLKIVMVVLSTALGLDPRLQSVGMAICSGLIAWQLLLEMPYYADWVNHCWVGLWGGIVYTCVLLNLIVFRYAGTPTAKTLTNASGDGLGAVLWGIFPAVAACAAASAARLWWLRRPLRLLRAAQTRVESRRDLRGVYRFRDQAEALLLARAMRRWDWDGAPLPAAADFGEFVLTARRDGQAARTQLQQASRGALGLLESYYHYKTQDLSKRLKDDSGGLDLAGHIELQRNYRACVRAHQMALAAQRALWATLLRDKLPFEEIRRAFGEMQAAEARAHGVYRRVLERYPSNGRLLRAYGRFLEWVRNDPGHAQRYYEEATKVGLQDSLLDLIGGGTGEGASQLVAGGLDEKQDGICIINSGGTILAVNKTLYTNLGYSKGELEGKNVSVLMPQPFASRHTSYIERYLSTGEARFIGRSRAVVAITKARAILPVQTSVAHLSGAGADAVFVGVMRTAQPTSDKVVRIWVTPGSRVILCADAHAGDHLGFDPGQMVGLPFARLGPDMNALDSFISDAATLHPDQILDGALKLRTRLTHRFIPPVEAELTVEFSRTDQERMLLINVEFLCEARRLFVVDHKGRVTFATKLMAELLGYAPRAMFGLELASLIPPPYGQLHPGFLKDMSAKPPSSSCRAGAVVHLQTATGGRAAATLKITTTDDGERVTHSVEAVPADEGVALARQRLELTVGQDGVVVALGPGAGRDAFGFAPELLVGAPLSSVVNVFAEHARRFGDGGVGLLLALGTRAAEGASDDGWRVGVLTPGSGEEGGRKSKGGSQTLAEVLRERRRVQPGIMQVRLLTSADSSLGGSVDDVRLSVVLWRAEAVAGVVEINGRTLAVTRADEAAGLLWGAGPKALMRRDFRGLVGLPPEARAADLLETRGGHGKKSGLKSGAAPRVGRRRRVVGAHADGSPVELEIQAASKVIGGVMHLAVRCKVLEPSTGALEPLLKIKDAVAARTSGAGGRRDDSGGGGGIWASAAGEREAGEGARSEAGGASEGGSSGGGEEEEERGRVLKRADDKRQRISQWAKSAPAGQEDGPDDADEDAAPGPHRGGPAYAGAGAESGGGPGFEAAAAGYGFGPGPSAAGAFGGPPGAFGGPPGAFGGPPGAFGGPPGGDEGSELSASEAGGRDATSMGGETGAGAEEELCVDYRRAKTLRKLERLLTGTAAQSATTRFRRTTILAMLALVAVHVAGFAIVTTQIESRYSSCYNSATMARAADRFQLTAMRANFLYRCNLPEFSGLLVCKDILSQRQRMLNNLLLTRDWHHDLYLGPKGQLQRLADPRIYHYWTFNFLPETTYHNDPMGGPGQMINGSAPLWTMGNQFVSDTFEIAHYMEIYGDRLDQLPAFEYVEQNGDASIFAGYAWSLDTLVDFAWSQMSSLSELVIVMLVVEAVLFQSAVVAAEFLAAKASDAQHMRRYAVFLALPSATLRAMSTRVRAVDDEVQDEAEDDDDAGGVGGATSTTAGGVTFAGSATLAAGSATLAAAEAGAAAAGAAGGGSRRAAGKSVRMAGGEEGRGDGGGEAEEEEEEEGGDKGRRRGRGRSAAEGGDSRRAAAAAAAAAAGDKRAPKTLAQRVKRLLLGWMASVVKLNGKKLLPSNAAIVRLMAPVLLWAVTVMVVFGVSYVQLQGLQAPLSSLNAAAQVTYRISRVRLFGNRLAFHPIDENRSKLVKELALLRSVYKVMLYGGQLPRVNPETNFNTEAPAGVFSSQAVANLFFKTTSCLRDDKTACFKPGHEYYEHTHSGLDIMIQGFMDAYAALANYKNGSFANDPRYQYITVYVSGNDMAQGLRIATDEFERAMIGAFAGCKDLHVAMLAVTLALFAVRAAFIVRPYCKRLQEESLDIAGMLSQLPAEVAAEEHVKTVVLGLPPRSEGGGVISGGSGGGLEPRSGGGGAPGGAQFGSAPGFFARPPGAAVGGNGWGPAGGANGGGPSMGGWGMQAQAAVAGGWRLGG